MTVRKNQKNRKNTGVLPRPGSGVVAGRCGGVPGVVGVWWFNGGLGYIQPIVQPLRRAERDLPKGIDGVEDE